MSDKQNAILLPHQTRWGGIPGESVCGGGGGRWEETEIRGSISAEKKTKQRGALPIVQTLKVRREQSRPHGRGVKTPPQM